jgi:hypothetical protein
LKSHKQYKKLVVRELHQTKQTKQSLSLGENSKDRSRTQLKRQSNNVDGTGVAGNYFCKVEKKIGSEGNWISS